MADNGGGSGQPRSSSERPAAEVMAQWALELHDAGGIEETAETAVAFACQAIDCDHAGIVLAGHPGPATIGTVTDELVTHLYQSQIESGIGPMLEALNGNAVVHVRDVTTERRWPDWAATAAAAGIGAVLHVPMQDKGRTVGVLSLFSTKPQAFSGDDEEIAVLLGRHAAIAVSEAQHDVDLHLALDARAAVGQAMGILMERFDLDEARAFAVLRRYSQDSNTKLRDVAQQLVRTRKLPPNHQPGAQQRPNPSSG